jgi:putative ABC transport system permease protein
VLVLGVATLVPAVRAARRPVTDVLRDVPPSGASWINRRLARLPRRLSLLGVREAASQPTRSALAALAISVAVVGTLASTGFIGAIQGVADDPARQGDPWDLAVTSESMPADDIAAALDATPGIATWFGEIERRSTLDGGAFLSVATGGDMAAIDYRIAEGRAVRGSGEAIAGYGFLQRFDREIGDRVDILVGTTPLTFEIVGWYRETEDSGEILRYPLADMNAVTPSEPSVYRVALDDSDEAATVVTAVLDRLGPEARVEVVDTGIDDVQPFLFALRLIAGMLIVMAAANLLVTLLAANRDAAGRTGVELTIGFTPRQVTTHGAVTGATTGLLACVVGVPLGLFLFRLLADTLSAGMGVGPGWMPMPAPFGVVLLTVGTIAITGALGAAAIARMVRRPASDLVRAE